MPEIHAERNNFSGSISTSWRKNEHIRDTHKGSFGSLNVFFSVLKICMDQTFPPSGGTKEAVVQRVNHVLFIKELYKVIHTCHKLRGMLVLI